MSNEIDLVLIEILEGHEPVPLSHSQPLRIDETRECKAGDWEGEIFAAHLAGLIEIGLGQRGLRIGISLA